MVLTDQKFLKDVKVVVRRCSKFLTTLQGQVANTWLTELTRVNKDFTFVWPKQPAPDRLTLRINQGPTLNERWIWDLVYFKSRFFIHTPFYSALCHAATLTTLPGRTHQRCHQVQHGGGKHGVHYAWACVGAGGRQEAKSWTGGPFWNDMVGSKPHKIVKPFKTKCAPETMLAFPRVFLACWGLLRWFGRFSVY